MPRRSAASARTIGTLLVAGVVIVLPSLRGGVQPWVVGMAAVACAASFALVSWSSNGTRLPVVAFVGVAGVVWIALQLVPLPPAVLGALSPGSTGLFDASLRPLGLYPAPRPASLDPGATALALARAVCCALALGVGAASAESPRRRHLLLRGIVIAAALAAAVLFGAAVTGFAPLFESRLLFVNPNHMAAFLLLGAFVALGLASVGHGQQRLLWTLAAAVIGLEACFSLSRGGLLALALGGVVFALVLPARSPGTTAEPRRSRVALALGVAVAAALALAILLFADPFLAELRTATTVTQEIKWTTWPRALALIARFPLSGIGAGAFPTVYPAFADEALPLTFTHVENQWLQLPVDLGLPVGLALLAAFAHAWWRGLRSRTSGLDAGVLAALAALALHEVFDFATDLPGVAIPFCLLIGLAARRQPGWTLRPGTTAAVAGLGALAAAGGVALATAHPPFDAASPGPGTADAWVSAASAAVPWHPLDFLPHAKAGTALAEAGRCDEALPWLARAMLLAPLYPQTHRSAAACLARQRQHARARAEFRLAFSLGDASALDEAARFYPRLETLLAIAPDTPDGLVALGLMLSRDRPEEALGPLARAWDDYGDVRALSGLAWCALRTGQLDDAIRYGRLLQDQAFDREGGYVVAARALAAEDRRPEARAELERGVPAVAAPGRLLGELVGLALDERRFADAHRLADRMPAGSVDELVARRSVLVGVYRAQGRLSDALREAEGASDAAPDQPGPALTAADVALEAGELDRAARALQRADAIPGADKAAIQRRRDAVEAARASGPLRGLEPSP